MVSIGADEHGLVCGFVLRPKRPAVPVDGEPGRVLATLATGAAGGEVEAEENAAGERARESSSERVWLHFNLTDVRAHQCIDGAAAMPPPARAVLLAADARVRIERVGPGLAGVLGDLHHDFVSEGEGIGLLRFYIDDRVFVTGRRHPLKSVDRLRCDLLEGQRVDDTAALLVHLLGHLADAFDVAMTQLIDAIDAAEDVTLSRAGAVDRQGLGHLRRVTARMHRHLAAERHALAMLLPRLPAWWSEPNQADLRCEYDRLATLTQDLELATDRARLLHEEIAGRASEETSRNLYYLSIVTTIFLPITLITGIFGMNVGGLPWLATPLGFWWVLLLIFLTVAVALIILHWRRLF